MISRLTFLALILVLVGCEPSFEYNTETAQSRSIIDGWPEYGGGTGARYFENSQINHDNVADLKIAWIHRSGDLGTRDIEVALQVTPITADDKLVYCTPFNKVIALDPATGGELWRFDPGIEVHDGYANQLVCRGVAQWQGNVPGAQCNHRILMGTNDGFLHAIDNQDGKPCPDFGDEGRVDLNRGVGNQSWPGEYQITSPPVVIDNLAIVGSAVSDNQRIDAPSGVVRAFDVRTGEQKWAFDLAPPGFDYDSELVSDEGFALGTPNVWGLMSADAARDLVFIPTGNPAPDYYRSGEPDMDYYGSAVIALKGSTGEVIWHFKTVLDDFWDYDLGAQPVLVDLEIDGQLTPALVQPTKMGFIYVLHRETGEPLTHVEYKDVPVEGPLAEQLSPIQPFPPEAYRVSPELTQDDEWGLLSMITDDCSEKFAESRIGPIFTPITESWTIVAPAHAGGINWGGVAVDPKRGVIFARSSHLPFQVRLVERANFTRKGGNEFMMESAPQYGQPYGMQRRPFTTAMPAPCYPPPWGHLTAISIKEEIQMWRQGHGTVQDLSGVNIPLPWGVPGLGGPSLLDSGLAIQAGAFENAIRIYDIETGDELWHHRLPAGPQAGPMTYSLATESGSKQFIVIAAGGHARAGTKRGDYLVAFSLP